MLETKVKIELFKLESSDRKRLQAATMGANLAAVRKHLLKEPKAKALPEE